MSPGVPAACGPWCGPATIEYADLQARLIPTGRISTPTVREAASIPGSRVLGMPEKRWTMMWRVSTENKSLVFNLGYRVVVLPAAAWLVAAHRNYSQAGRAAVAALALAIGWLPLVLGIAIAIAWGFLEKHELFGHVPPLAIGSTVCYRNTDRVGSVMEVSATRRRYRVDFGTHEAWLPLRELTTAADVDDRAT